ncbi:hypothetical protein [Nostoc sp.]
MSTMGCDARSGSGFIIGGGSAKVSARIWGEAAGARNGAVIIGLKIKSDHPTQYGY